LLAFPDNLNETSSGWNKPKGSAMTAMIDSSVTGINWFFEATGFIELEAIPKRKRLASAWDLDFRILV